VSTGIDIPNDVIGLLAETVERGASLLAGGSRLAGPAAAQDEAAELAPDESAGTVGLGLSFADDTAVVVVSADSLEAPVVSVVSVVGVVGVDSDFASVSLPHAPAPSMTTPAIETAARIRPRFTMSFSPATRAGRRSGDRHLSPRESKVPHSDVKSP